MIFTILDIQQLKKIGDYENIYSANPLYLINDKVGGHIEEYNWKKYLAYDSAELRPMDLHSKDKKKQKLKKYR